MGDLKNILDKTIAASQTKSEKTLTALTDSSTKLQKDLQSDFSIETIQIIQDTVRNSDTASLDDLTTRIARLRELQRYVAASEVGATESTILKNMIDTALKTLIHQVRVKKDLLTKVRGAVKSHAVNAGALMVAMSGRDPLVALGVKLVGDKLMDWRRRKKEVTAERKHQLAEDAKQIRETQQPSSINQQSDPNIDDDISSPQQPLRKQITIHRDSDFSNTQPTDIASINPFKNVLEDIAMFTEENTSILLNIKELVATNGNVMAEMDFMQSSRSMEDALRPILHEPELIRYESSDSSTPGNMFKPILEDMSMFTEESTGVLIQIRDLMTTEFHERDKSRAELRRKGFSDIELEIEAERKREKSLKLKTAGTFRERIQSSSSSISSGAKGAIVDATSIMSGVIGGTLIGKLISRLAFRVPILGILKGTLGITGAILAPALSGIYGYLKQQSRGGTGFGGFVGGILGGPQFKNKLLNVAANMGSYAFIGAKLGSVVPGVGTALGAVVGGMVGGLMAYLGPQKIANYVEDVGVWAFDQMAAMFNGFINGINTIRHFFEKTFNEGYVRLLKAQRAVSFSKSKKYLLTRQIEALENEPQSSINVLPTDARTFSEVRRDNANLRAEGNTATDTNRVSKQPRKSGKGETGVLSQLNEKYQKYRSQGSSEQGRFDPKTMNISKAGIEFIKKHEGFKSTPYWDVNGWAIGYGSHRMPDGRPVQPGDRISRQEADKQLREWVNAEYTSNIRRVIKRPLTQNEFDALASIAWNAGGGSFKESSRVVRAINEGDFEKAAREIKRHYATVEGKHHPVISQRREEESAMFLSSLRKPEQRADLTTKQPDTRWKQLTAPPSGLQSQQPIVNVVNQSSVATSHGPSGAMDHTVGGTDSRLSSVMYFS